MSDTTVCKVCIPNTFGYLYDYIPHPSMPPIGSRVYVSFRNKKKTGFIWAYEVIGEVAYIIKPIEQIDTNIIFDDHLRQFCQWLSDYYHAPLSEILALACPKFLRDIQRPLTILQPLHLKLTRDYLQHLQELSPRLQKTRKLVHYLEEQGGQHSSALLRQAGFPKAFQEQALALHLCEKTENQPPPRPPALELSLNSEQQLATNKVLLNQFNVYLLQGVTGSGKTEVYIELMKKVMYEKRQVLMLVPEIGLTTALFERMQKRLGVEGVLFHSSLTDKQRFENWLKVHSGQVLLILGTRSAVFANLPNLGLIIIDEEHDPSFKQIEGIRYSAKDAAVMRAKIANVPIILGTATPSLETYQNMLSDKYQLLTLTHKALNQIPLRYHVIDLRSQSIENGLAKTTLQLIEKHLAQNEQVLVFINRRGYSPLIFCHDCGWAKHCQNCDANMTWHRKNKCLMCHHCGAKDKVPEQCQSCFSQQLVPMGVGTERLVEFLNEYFPNTKTLRFDRDVVRNREQLEIGLESIQQQKVQLIVGTQMLTKGHHFPKLGLVVIVDGDSGFYQTDFRALERLGQMFTQVSGRAGRAEIAGEVCIQTHLPQHPLLLRLLQEGYSPFIQTLLTQRQEAYLPPFTHLALLRAQGKNSISIQQFLKKMLVLYPMQQITVLGPAPAPMEKKAGIFRWQLILKAHQRQKLHQELRQFLPILHQNTPKGIRCFVEIDPYDWSA